MGQCDVPEPNTDFVAVAAGADHNLGLKPDGTIVAWGNNWLGQSDVPEPNTGYVAVAAGWIISLAVRGYPRGDMDGDLDVELGDLAAFAGCLTGPGGTEPPPGCTPEQFRRADIENDEDADLEDFAVVQGVFTGSP